MTEQKQQIPIIGRQTGWCPRECKAYTGFNRLDRTLIAPVTSRSAGSLAAARAEGVSDSPLGLWVELWVCHVCQGAIVVTEQRLMVPGATPEAPFKESVVSRRVISPPPEGRPLDPSIPEKIRSVFDEAAKTEAAGAYRAAAVMYRAVVEEVCTDQQAPGNNLKQKIAGLAQRGAGPDLLADMDEARLLGNWSIHQGVTFSAAEVADVASLVEEALVEIYVQPAQRKAMRDARKARRDGVGQQP